MSPPNRPLLAAFWSVAIPGFGQLYNGKTIKGILFILLEFIINVQSHLNSAIYYSWLFDIEQAQHVLDYEWLLFYPCFYVFSIYDAYHDCCILTNRPIPRLLGLPFIATAMVGTVGVIISSGPLAIAGLQHLGPIFTGVIVLVLVMGFGSWLVSHMERVKL